MNPKDEYRLYLEAKERHPGMILMVRGGEAYHMFGTDAETVASVCELSVFPAHHGIPSWAGFPDDMLEACLRKLLKAGHRGAICDQIEPLALPKRVEVNRIVTGGCRMTFDEEDPDDQPDPAWGAQPSFLPGNSGDLECTRQRTLFDLGERMPLSQPNRNSQLDLF